MKNQFLISILLIITTSASAQNVGISNIGATPDASAMLDVASTNKGLLIPRIALSITTSALPIISPANSLLVYNTASVADVLPGYYYWNATKWVALNNYITAWHTVGNSGTNSVTNFIGTTDAQDLVVKTNNTEKMRITQSGNVGIGGTPHPSAKLDLSSSNQGFLITRVDTANIVSPAFGLMTLSTADSCLYLYSGTRWARVGGVGKKCKCKLY